MSLDSNGAIYHYLRWLSYHSQGVQGGKGEQGPAGPPGFQVSAFGQTIHLQITIPLSTTIEHRLSELKQIKNCIFLRQTFV